MDFKEQYLKEKGYASFNKYNENEYTKFLEQILTETNQDLQLLQSRVSSQVDKSYNLKIKADLNPYSPTANWIKPKN